MPRIDPADIDLTRADWTGRGDLQQQPPLMHLKGEGDRGWQFAVDSRVTRLTVVFASGERVRMLAETDNGDVVEYEATDVQIDSQFNAVANHGPGTLDLPHWERPR